tara:strand:- start:100 stop:525 length:426 start_codon:yes stop_codon:yes gene_type:complete
MSSNDIANPLLASLLLSYESVSEEEKEKYSSSILKIALDMVTHSVLEIRVLQKRQEEAYSSMKKSMELHATYASDLGLVCDKFMKDRSLVRMVEEVTRDFLSEYPITETSHVDLRQKKSQLVLFLKDRIAAEKEKERDLVL